MSAGIIVGFVIEGIICGWICESIASNRNMEGGFWWGFFLSIIGIIIVAVRPNDTPSYQSSGSNNAAISYDDMEKRQKEILDNGGWRCSCGHVNFNYQANCGACNKSRQENSAISQPTLSSGTVEEKSNIAKIREFKELLDEGIITQEEFDKKKKQLLEL